MQTQIQRQIDRHKDKDVEEKVAFEMSFWSQGKFMAENTHTHMGAAKFVLILEKWLCFNKNILENSFVLAIIFWKNGFVLTIIFWKMVLF